MAETLKSIKKGLTKYRPGFSRKITPKVKPKSFKVLKSGEVKGIDILNQAGVKQVTFIANMTSEFPALRTKQAKDTVKHHKKRIKEIKKLMVKAKAREKAELKKELVSRKKNIVVYTNNPPAKSYRTRIRFEGVNFSDKKSDAFPVPAKVGNKLKYHELLKTGKHKVSMRCNCQSFRHEYSRQLANKGSLIGGAPNYHRLTKPLKRPVKPSNPNPFGHDFVNPNNLLGYCKHTRNLLRALKKANFFKEA